MTIASRPGSPAAPKVKKTVTLDADLVAAIGEGNLSSEVNEALAERVHRLRRAQALAHYLERYVATEGALDETQVSEFVQLLGGVSHA